MEHVPRYQVGQRVSVLRGHHRGERGYVVEVKNTWRFGWTYRVRLEPRRDIWVTEDALQACGDER